MSSITLNIPITVNGNQYTVTVRLQVVQVHPVNRVRRLVLIDRIRGTNIGVHPTIPRQVARRTGIPVQAPMQEMQEVSNPVLQPTTSVDSSSSSSSSTDSTVSDSTVSVSVSCDSN